MALSPAPVNQPSFRANPVQSYIANQPYFNQFTGKDVTSSSINRPMSRFSSLTSSEANSFNRYYNTFPAASTWGLDVDNRLALDLTTKKQKEKPDSRQMENKKMSTVLVSRKTPLSTAGNIPIFRPYEGDKLDISRSNSYLFHNLYPLANSNFLRRNDNKGTSFSFYSKPLTQNAVLTNSLPYSHKERTYSVTQHPVEGSLRNRFTPVSQINTLASSIGLYQNQNKITSSPLVNGFLKDRTFPNDGVTDSFHNIETGQALPANPRSYFRPPIKSTPSDYFQLTQYSFFKPVSTNVANDSDFRSPLESAFYPYPTLLGKGDKIFSTEDKVVTEGELKEKGLLKDILFRDHIRRKPGNVRKEQLNNK